MTLVVAGRKVGPREGLLLVPPLAAAILFGVSVRHRSWYEPWFVHSAYYVLFTMVAVYAGVLVTGLARGPSPHTWLHENWAGLLTTAVISTVVLGAVAPGYRVLADEANLIGVSKNLFFQRTANFAVTGKWYFETYWNIGEVTDRRPALFPFCVSLIHAVRGYRADNAFVLNAGLFVFFVFSSYRLAKCLGGEVFGIVAAILVAASPTTLVSARSAGFDFFATCLLLVIVQSFHDHVTSPSPRRLAMLMLNLCLLTHVRYEGGALIGLTTVLLLLFKRVRRADFRGFEFVYALVPLFLLPRYWQALAKANDAEQPLTTKLFGASHFVRNVADYFRLFIRPFDVEAAHAPLLIILGSLGFSLILVQLALRMRARTLSWPHTEFAGFIVVILAAQAFLYFSYQQGEPMQPASARLFIWLDTFLAFAAAWLLVTLGKLVKTNGAWGPHTLIPVLIAGALFTMYLPCAVDPKFISSLILTRQSAAEWRFFEKLDDKGILILSDRPGLFTIMNYGASDIGDAEADRGLLVELSRHLYRDIYLVQEVDLATNKPLPGFAVWPDIEKETVLEFQNTDSSSVRIAKVKH